MKPDPLLTPQQGRTILRWVQEEMKLKTIFVIDSVIGSGEQCS